MGPGPLRTARRRAALVSARLATHQAEAPHRSSRASRCSSLFGKEPGSEARLLSAKACFDRAQRRRRPSWSAATAVRRRHRRGLVCALQLPDGRQSLTRADRRHDDETGLSAGGAEPYPDDEDAWCQRARGPVPLRRKVPRLCDGGRTTRPATKFFSLSRQAEIASPSWRPRVSVHSERVCRGHGNALLQTFRTKVFPYLERRRRCQVAG